ncbi:MAG: SDH family Clp fold serine proteinase [Stenotrophomonas geniculata]
MNSSAIHALRTEDPDRDYLLVSAGISRRLHTRLSDLLSSRPLKSKATVFLTTYGGDPDGGYRIARCLRHYYKDGLRIAVPSWCKSAGTLVAIAGDELAIGDRGELGPLDIQVFKGSELLERSSGLDITEALGFVSDHVRWGYHSMLKEARRMGLSTKLAAEMAAHIGAAVAGPLLNQVDPLRLGELQRATRIAHEYGSRLDAYSRNLKPDALQSLISGYPSHSFVIDRKEANDLFHRVFPLTAAESGFVEKFWGAFAEPLEEDPELIDFSKFPIPTVGTPNEPSPEAANDNVEAGAGPDPEHEQQSGDPQPGGEGVRVRSGVQDGENGEDADGGSPEAGSGGLLHTLMYRSSGR